ncbi:hypothetical protein [Vibrio renipiscarius]|uniref:Uncharacterized protein n=1 Tax=Vibrio renipiscarius TaxID=1461322 RepID=A0A0C2N968_9VIBR|nr:hypothetical protein [Vibrio renipiscarius]KII76181.1 hypothetical protein OJ16_15320 [Vibrio renipiscarius]KII78297.1 hypothetical protein PL18_15250 [Vibrio renipiscarius]
MSNLTQVAIEIGIENLDVFDIHSPQWQTFCDSNDALFERVITAKPDKAHTHHLLGVLTKAHIEALSRVEKHHDAVQAMHQALEQNVGSHHQNNFHYQDGEQLAFVTHAWLYVQGYLGMDFSLANDHANSSAQALKVNQEVDAQALRSQFMASFYQGKEQGNAHLSHKKSSHPILEWFKKRFH